MSSKSSGACARARPQDQEGKTEWDAMNKDTFREMLDTLARRALAAVFVASISAFGAAPALAQERPYSLVCFEQSDLRTTLSRVVNIMQFLRNDSTLRRKSCDFAQVPSGSSARFIELFATKEGFIYPIFLVRYATTGQRMYSADGIFRSSDWRIRRPCGPNRAFGCIVPKDCGVLEGFIRLSEGRVRNYMFVPKQCETLIVR